MILADGAAWSAWTSVTPIEVRSKASGFVRVRIPQAIPPDRDGGFAGLRVLDAADREIPYAIEPTPPRSPDRTVPLIDAGFVPGRGTQAVADLGPTGELENALTLAIDASALPTFFESVDIEASDDRKVWRTIRTGATIYRVAQDGGTGNQTMSFPPTRSRWLRIRIASAHAAIPLTGASVARSVETSRDLDVLSALRWHETISDHTQTWVARADGAVRPAAVRFRTHPGEAFSRLATIAVSDDGKTWNDIGSETIANYADGTKHVAFGVDAATATTIRIVVDDGNDRPIDVTPELFEVRHSVVFAADPSTTYRLVSGNTAVSAPSYDLGDRLAHQTWHASDDAGTGLTSVRPPVDARSFSERYPWALTVVIVVVAVALGALALATIRSAKEVTE